MRVEDNQSYHASSAPFRSAPDASARNIADAKISADRLACSFVSIVLEGRGDAEEVQEVSIAPHRVLAAVT